MKKEKLRRRLKEKNIIIKRLEAENRILMDAEEAAFKLAELAAGNANLLRERLEKAEARDDDIEETLRGYEDRFFGEGGEELAIVDVFWDGNRTEVFWSDGTSTVVNKAEGEAYNRQTALAFAISKKVLSCKLEKIVEYYDDSEKAVEKRNALQVYKCLQSRCYKKRKKAEEKWNSLPQDIKQSVKETAKSKKHAWND